MIATSGDITQNTTQPVKIVDLHAENNAVLNFGDCDNWNDKPFMHSLNPGDPMAMRNYTQYYKYDEVGNIMEMRHRASGGDWTRGYEYEDTNNRLKRTFIGDNGNPANYTKYEHHSHHGYMIELPHLEKIDWNFKEEVVLTSRQHCTEDNIPVISYYQYDSNGQRIRKITENQTIARNSPNKKDERIYISGYELYKKHSGSDTGLERVSLSLMDKEHRFVMIETRNHIKDGTEKKLIRYQLHNHLGSAALELAGTCDAKVISYEEYHPYGITAYQAKNSAINSAAKRYRYTGMERDDETGLEYHRARYYMPWLGRWLSADPIGIGDGVNMYAYVKNNLINSFDANGKQQKGYCYIDPNHPSCGVCEPAKEEEPEEVHVRGKPRQKAESKPVQKVAEKASLDQEKKDEESTAEVVVDVVTDFIPIVGGGKDIYKGVKEGNWLLAGMGVGSIILDVMTLGGSSLVKGGIKTGLKQGAKFVAKELTEKEATELIAKEVAEKAAKEAAEKKAVEGLGESLIKAEKKTSLKVDIAGQSHSQSAIYRDGIGKLVESAHMVPTSAIRHLQNYSRGKALTVLLPRQLHRQFDANWMKTVRELRKLGKSEITVAEWKKILSTAASSVDGLKGRMADTIDFMLDVEFYQTLKLSPTDMLPLPKFK